MNKIFKKILLALTMLSTSLAMADDVAPEYLKIGHNYPWMSNIMMKMRVNNKTGCDNIKLMHNGYVSVASPSFVSAPANAGLPATNFANSSGKDQFFTDLCKITDNANPTNHKSGDNLWCRTFGNGEQGSDNPQSATLVALGKFGGRSEQELSTFNTFFSITDKDGNRAGFYGIVASIVNNNNDAVKNQVSKGDNYIATGGRRTWTYSIASKTEWPYIKNGDSFNITTSFDAGKSTNKNIMTNYGFDHVSLATGYAYTTNIISENPPLCTSNTPGLGTVSIYPKISINIEAPEPSQEPNWYWADHDSYLKEMQDSQAAINGRGTTDNPWMGGVYGYGTGDDGRCAAFAGGACSYAFSRYHTHNIVINNQSVPDGRARCETVWLSKGWVPFPGNTDLYGKDAYARCYFAFQPQTFTVDIDKIMLPEAKYQKFTINGTKGGPYGCEFKNSVQQKNIISDNDKTSTLNNFTDLKGINDGNEIRVYKGAYDDSADQLGSLKSKSADLLKLSVQPGYTLETSVKFTTQDGSPIWVRIDYKCDK